METLNGFANPKKLEITPHSALGIARIAIADNIFLTILQKRESRRNDPPFDIMKMQVA
jgi:hypothetical protein